MTLHRVLLLVAFLCFLLAAIGVPTSRIALVPLGLALWILTLIV